MLASDLWELGDKRAALDRIQQALQVEPSYLWAWGRLAAWSAYAGARQQALQFGRRLCQTRPASAFAHFGLASLLEEGVDFEEKLGELKSAIAHDPTLAQAHDELARLLADVGRYDEARAACAPAALGQPPPTALRGRAAIIEWLAGQRGQAVALMAALVEDAPDYLFGWTTLAGWRSEEGDKAGAREALRRAQRLAPERTEIGESLFQLQIEDGALEGAADTLKELRRELPEAATRLLAMRLALAQDRTDDALATLEAIAAVSPADWSLLEQAGDLLAKNGRGLSLQRWLERARARGPVSAGLAYLWGARAEVGFLSRWRQLARWRRQTGEDAGEVGVLGTLGYVERLGASGSAGELRWFVRLQRAALRADTRLWGAVGYAFLARNLGQQGLRWLADWRDRPGVEPWMLQNAVTALRDAGRDDEAREASQAALALPWDGAVMFHRRWLALEAALAEPFEEASRVVAIAPAPEQSADAVIVAMARAALAIRSEEVPAELRTGLVRGYLEQAAGDDASAAARPFARRLRRRIAELARRRGVRI